MLSLANIACFALILTEVLLNRLLRSNGADKRNADKNSISIIWVTMIAAIVLAIFVSQKIFLPIYLNSSLQYVGVAVIFIAIIFRLAAVFTLGPYFTVDVTIRRDHKLKKDGLYKYLRHPSYSASLISFVGMGWTFNNWISLFLVTGAILVTLINRIKVEEEVLIQHFGLEYIEYKKTTKGLIPFIY